MHDPIYETTEILSLERKNDAHNKSLHASRKRAARFELPDVHLFQWFSNFPPGNTSEINKTASVRGIAFNKGACSKLKVSVVRGPDRGILQTAEVSRLNYIRRNLICLIIIRS